MCPPIGGVSPQINPFLNSGLGGTGDPAGPAPSPKGKPTPDGDGTNTGKAGPADGDKAGKAGEGGPHGVHHHKHVHHVEGATSGAVDSKANVKLAALEGGDNQKNVQVRTLTLPGKPPTGDGMDGTAKRLADMAIEMAKDGPAGAFLGRMLLQSAARQRESKTEQMVTERQTAVSLKFAAADQLAQSGKDLMSSAVTSLALGLVGAGFHSVNKHTEAGAAKSTRIDAGSKLFDKSSDFASTHGQSESKLDESQQQVDEANAEQASMVADQAKAALDKIDDNGKQTLDFVKELQDINNDMQKAITG